MRILILGPQGSGKGTQAKRIAAAYDIPHVATGDILREAVANGSEFGALVRPILERGDLVPDDLMVGLIRERLADEDGFVLDGFPRTMAQAEALDAMLEDIGKPLDAVILLQVSTRSQPTGSGPAPRRRVGRTTRPRRSGTGSASTTSSPSASSIATGSPGRRWRWTASRRWTRSSRPSRTRSQVWE